MLFFFDVRLYFLKSTPHLPHPQPISWWNLDEDASGVQLFLGGLFLIHCYFGARFASP